MQLDTLSADRLIRQKEVLRRLGIAKSTLQAWVKAQRFPAPVRLGPRAIAWSENEVNGWINARVADAKGGRHASA